MMKVFKKDHCQLTYKPGSQDAITTKNEMIYNLLYLYVLRLKIRLDRHLFLLVRCLVVSCPKFDFTSPKGPSNIFLRSNIFVLNFEIFKLQYLLMP